jgi:hypothetical protein
MRACSQELADADGDGTIDVSEVRKRFFGAIL